MFYESLQLNYKAIVLCIILNIVLAMLWYQPFVFGKIWSRLSAQPLGGAPNPRLVIIGIISTIVSVMSLGFLFAALDIKTLAEAIFLALVLGIGILGAANLPVNRYNAQPLALFFLDSGLSLFSLVLNACILWLM